MPTIAIEHVTRYRYRQPVAFGEHRIRMRPRESYDQRLLAFTLAITPEPVALRWFHDVIGNAVAIARFGDQADTLEVRASARVDHRPAASVPGRAAFPPVYPAGDLPDLAPAMARLHPDEHGPVAAWAARFRPGARDGAAPDVLGEMTRAIQRDFTYRAREEEGTQTPAETLRAGTGSCRDFAVLMMEAARALGFAARFVSGYLYAAGSGKARVGGQSTHAWVSVFLPGHGWTEFDPTNGIVGNNGLVRVAVARDPAQAKPMTGSWAGPRGSDIEMSVDVRIERLGGTAALGDKDVGAC